MAQFMHFGHTHTKAESIGDIENALSARFFQFANHFVLCLWVIAINHRVKARYANF